MSKLDDLHEKIIASGKQKLVSTVPGLRYKIVKIQGDKAHYFSVLHAASGELVYELPMRTRKIAEVVSLANSIFVRGEWNVSTERLEIGPLHKVMREFATAVRALG